MEATTENSGTTQTPPSGLSVDWSAALQSSEFRAGLAKIVAKTVSRETQVTVTNPC